MIEESDTQNQDLSEEFSNTTETDRSKPQLKESSDPAFLISYQSDQTESNSFLHPLTQSSIRYPKITNSENKISPELHEKSHQFITKNKTTHKN